MTHPVAPGADGYNLLSKRHLFRVVLAKTEDASAAAPLEGPLIIESKDGSYYFECDFADADEEDGLLVFDTYLKDRSKQYVCYFKDRQKGRFRWSDMPRKLVNLDHSELAKKQGA
jgi:hypothetical protein